MSKLVFSVIATALILGACSVQKQEHKYEQRVVFPEGSTLEEKLAMAADLVPSPRQAKWQEYELTAFLHFGMNTFTDREWGDGSEDPALFAPTDLDAEQWVRTLKDAGFKLVILTAKHHDGFCLWQTKTTKHSVASSPWKDGRGDVVAELAEACHKYDMRLGIYLSPWDRHHPTYGTGEAYNKVYIEQLTELLTHYGKVDEVWFDGANGEGPNGKKQIYDWAAVAETISRLQPEAVTAIMGNDVRWVGNERGYGRDTEWSATVLPPGVLPQADSIRTALGIDETVADLGSREWIDKAGEMYWWPSEVDVSIRPGWFYHEDQDDEVKSLSVLARNIYFSSVGMNSSLLLNVPPNREGRLSDADVSRLKAFGDFVRAYNASDAVREGQDFVPDADNTLELALDPNAPFSSILLQEDILRGQRVAAFEVDAMLPESGSWTKIAEGTTIGYKRILVLDTPLTAEKIRIRILESRGPVTLKSVKAPLIPEIADSTEANDLTYIDSKGWRVEAEEPLTLDLGTVQTITGFVYAMRADRTAETLPTHFRFEVSTDGKIWVTTAEDEFGNIINNPIPQVYRLRESVAGRYVRLYGSSLSGVSLSVAAEELKLF